jgi:hypothetical protein
MALSSIVLMLAAVVFLGLVGWADAAIMPSSVEQGGESGGSMLVFFSALDFES